MMIFGEEILHALENVSPRAWEGEVWRYVPALSNPILPNTTGARWNPRDTAALYTSLEKETVLAELDYMRAIQTPPLRRSVFRLHRIHLRVNRMLDLRDRNVLEVMGIRKAELTGDDHIHCQKAGGAAAWLGFDSILVPSARFEGDNLVVFVDEQNPGALLEVAESQDVPD